MKKQFVTTFKSRYLLGLFIFDRILKEGDIEKARACYDDLLAPMVKDLFEDAHKAGITNEEIVEALVNL